MHLIFVLLPKDHCVQRTSHANNALPEYEGKPARRKHGKRGHGIILCNKRGGQSLKYVSCCTCTRKEVLHMIVSHGRVNSGIIHQGSEHEIERRKWHLEGYVLWMCSCWCPMVISICILNYKTKAKKFCVSAGHLCSVHVSSFYKSHLVLCQTLEDWCWWWPSESSLYSTWHDFFMH